MTKNVDKLTSNPSAAETPMATTAALVYSYLRTNLGSSHPNSNPPETEGEIPLPGRWKRSKSAQHAGEPFAVKNSGQALLTREEYPLWDFGSPGAQKQVP